MADKLTKHTVAAVAIAKSVGGWVDTQGIILSEEDANYVARESHGLPGTRDTRQRIINALSDRATRMRPLHTSGDDIVLAQTIGAWSEGVLEPDDIEFVIEVARRMVKWSDK